MNTSKDVVCSYRGFKSQKQEKKYQGNRKNQPNKKDQRWK